MPATPIASNSAYVPGVSTSTLHLGSVQAGDIICFFGGAFTIGFPFWNISDNLGNGTALDTLGNPIYATGAFQYPPGVFKAVVGCWAVSLIDGDLTVTINTTTGDHVTPFVIGQLNAVRVYRFPKVYAIDQGSVAMGWFLPGGGINTGCRSGPFNYADTLVVSAVMCPTEVTDFSSLTGDTLVDTVIEPSGGPFIPARTLLILERSSAGPGYGNVEIQYNDSQGASPANPGVAVMTFSIPLPDPIGLRSLGGRQYAVRGGTGSDANPDPGVSDQQADWNRPIYATFPYEVKIGDLVFVDLFVPQRNPTTIDVHDEYGPGFPLLPPPYVNEYTQRIICAPTGSGAGLLNGYMAIYTCVVNYIPVQQHPGWQAGGIFQVRLDVSKAGSDALYQATAIGITAITVNAPTTVLGLPSVANPYFLDAFDYAVAGLKDLTQVSTNQLMVTDEIQNVPRGAYLHAIAAYLPNNTQSSMTWTELESYTIKDESHWDFFQYPGEGLNAPRTCALAVMDKFALVRGTYGAQTLAVLLGFAASGGILLITVTFPATLLPKYRRRRYL